MREAAMPRSSRVNKRRNCPSSNPAGEQRSAAKRVSSNWRVSSQEEARASNTGLVSGCVWLFVAKRATLVMDSGITPFRFQPRLLAAPGFIRSLFFPLCLLNESAQIGRIKKGTAA